MTFRLVFESHKPASAAPFRVVDEQGEEVEWINRFLDMQRVRGLQELSLRAYAYTLLHFVRWWSQRPGVDARRFDAAQFTESTLIDYVRDQRNELPKLTPETINWRSGMIRRVFQFYFHQDMPHGPYQLQRLWWVPQGNKRRALAADLRLKVPPRVIEPLSREQVARFWSSFRTSRDMALVGLMLLNGLRSREALSLQMSDLELAEAQLRVHGKGARVRMLPLAPEIVRALQCYLQTERPAVAAGEVFVSLKGKARGKPMTPAGLRSLFRHHRAVSGVRKANPHRLRHTFGRDMIRAGVSLPALMRLMGHVRIQTTLLYIQLSPQDVYAEYARAVARLAEAAATGTYEER